MNTTQPSTPDPIQAAAMELGRKLTERGVNIIDRDIIGIATAMRELVAREQSDNVILKREIENWRNICEDKITEIFKLSELVKHLEETGEAEAAIDADEKKRLRERVAELERSNETYHHKALQEMLARGVAETQLAAARRDAERLTRYVQALEEQIDEVGLELAQAAMQREDGK